MKILVEVPACLSDAIRCMPQQLCTRSEDGNGCQSVRNEAAIIGGGSSADDYLE